MNLIKVILFIVLIFLSSFVKAQSPIFRHYSTDQGLSSLETYHVFQDSKGYIWISTTNGVTRFDGYTFQNFEEQDGLSDNVIFETIEDFKGRVWFVGFNCKLSYYENGQIKRYPYNNVIEKLTNSRMLSVKSSFYIDKYDNVYLSVAYRGIICISAKGVLSVINNNSGNLADVFEKEHKVFVIQHSGFINSLKINTKNIHTVVKDTKLEKSRKLAVFSTLTSDHKSIFVACDHYLLKVQEDGKYQIREMESRIIWLSRDKNNLIWVGSYNGGAIALNENNLMGPFVHNYLTDKSVSSVLQDKEGGLWFSTLDEGVFYLPSHNTFSYVYPTDLPYNEVSNIETGENELYLGMDNGFLSVIKNNNKIINYPIDTNLHSDIISLKYDRLNKQLYIGATYNTYIYKNGKISPLINFSDKRNKKYEGRMITFNSIAKESDNAYWFGNFSGLSLIDVKQKIVLANSNEFTRKSFKINSIYRYPDGSLLIGSLDGLWIYKNNTFTKATNIIPGLKDRVPQIAGD